MAGFARESDGPSYPVSDLTIRYLRENELHPPIEDALQVEVTLGQTSTGFVAPRDDVAPITFRLALTWIRSGMRRSFQQTRTARRGSWRFCLFESRTNRSR